MMSILAWFKTEHSPRWEDMHTVMLPAFCLAFQQKGYTLLRILLIIHCLCACVESKRKCIRKGANLRIWPSLFPPSPSLLTLCCSFSLQQASSSLWSPRLQMVYTWYAFLTDITGKGFVYTLVVLKSIYLSLSFSSLRRTNTHKFSFIPKPEGNRYPVLICGDVTTVLRWMVHIRLSPNKSGKKKEKARDRRWGPRVTKKRKKHWEGGYEKMMKKTTREEENSFPLSASFSKIICQLHVKSSP